MANAPIVVSKFTAHELHKGLSILVVTEATDNNLKDRIFAVPSRFIAGDYMYVTEMKNLLGKNPKRKFLLRQRTVKVVVTDITEAFGAMTAALSEAEEAPQETAPVKLTLVK